MKSRQSQAVVNPAYAAHPAKPGLIAPVHRGSSDCKMGNQATQQFLRDAVIQTKLTVSQPGDKFEQEADRVADTVMRMPDLSTGTLPRIQRMCSECEKDLHRKESDSAPPNSMDVRLSYGVGRPLPESVRDFFEPRLGHDFSAVRVHTDSSASASAKALGAVAYTAGNNIVFAQGEYAPQTDSGRYLLAHELTHVVQQDASSAFATSPGEHIQRLVRRSLLNGCAAGQNPFGADRRASLLLTNALARIDAAQAARPGDPANADVVAVGGAMHTAFRLDQANNDNWNLAAPHFGLPLIRRRLEIARDYIDGVVFTFNCCAVGGACPATCGACVAGDEAFTCAGEASTITLCPPFWAHGVDQRGRVLAHEVLHIDFGFINDWGQPDEANAHCYAQFTALVNGFNSPAGFRCH